MANFKAADFLALMERERITYTLIVPAMYNLCLLQPDFERYDLSAWRIGGFGGHRCPCRPSNALPNRCRAEADECLRRNRDHLARDPDAAAVHRRARG
jgi:non-ribosomal peptide synthetase component E (peptide arylation enzyme)